jgi:predicted thioesterase
MAKEAIAVGAVRSRVIDIDEQRVVSFLGENVRIYATPALINDVETACLEFLLEYLDTGENSVGTSVNIQHTGATLLGMNVEISFKVTQVEGRAITFEVTARDALETICTGIHKRFIIDVEKMRARVESKAKKAATVKPLGAAKP